METEPMMVAVSKEIKAPMYIDLQTVRRADGLSRFRAIAHLPVFLRSPLVKLASISLTLILLDHMKSKVVASLSLYS